ncbi:hypothetical protein ACLOJK_021425 [Asimina triloba]
MGSKAYFLWRLLLLLLVLATAAEPVSTAEEDPKNPKLQIATGESFDRIVSGLRSGELSGGHHFGPQKR